MRAVQVGDLVKIRDPEKQSWIIHNPWMALKWGLHTVYLVTEERRTTKLIESSTKKPVSLFKIVNTETGDYKWAKADEVEVFSKKV